MVSVVIPVYNMEDSIETCIESILKQSFTNFEVILVDDGSTDDSYQKCCNIVKKDARVIAYHTNNAGAGPARNFGIVHARGEYIYFPDADDYIDPDTLSFCVDAMENGRYDLVVFGFKTLTRSGKFLFEKRYDDAEKSGEELRRSYSESFGYTSKYAIQGAPWNKLFSLETIRKYGIEFPALRRHQDEAFISRYMCHASNVHFIAPVLYYYYENDLNNQWKKFPANYIDIVNGLYAIRKETVLKWNSEDYKTYNLVEIEYVSKVVKALELAFSPALKMKQKAKKEYLQTILSKSSFDQFATLQGVGMYQKIVCKCLIRKRMNMVLGILHLKLWMEKAGFLTRIRSALKIK